MYTYVVCMPVIFIFKYNATDSGVDRCVDVAGKMYASLTILPTQNIVGVGLFEKSVIICSCLSLFGVKSLPRKN